MKITYASTFRHTRTHVNDRVRNKVYGRSELMGEIRNFVTRPSWYACALVRHENDLVSITQQGTRSFNNVACCSGRNERGVHQLVEMVAAKLNKLHGKVPRVLAQSGG